ncbi:MAG: 8-amino-7-oxononanoate synthase [Bdellovibrionales bacterium]
MKNFQEKIYDLKDKGRYRSLSLPQGIDLTSNDYLGLVNDPYLKNAALEFLQQNDQIGSGGSRLLRGHTASHDALERFAAVFFVAPKALYFSTGFQANQAIFQALPSRHDTIIFDEFVHASAREAIQKSHARHIKVRHNALQGFENAIKEAIASERAHIWVVVESVYSMDGDLAPLAGIYALVRQYPNITLIVDEAHATAVLGTDGKGLAYDLYSTGRMPDNLITLHTCGKALGVAGGLVCGSHDVVDMLVNTARAFIYSTAPMPLQAYLVQKALEFVASDDGAARRDRLKNLSKKAQQLFGGAGTHIVPLIIGDDARAVYAAKMLQHKGWDIRAIRPPTVPDGTARLRLSLSANLDEDTLENFAADFNNIKPLAGVAAESHD